ncbi:SLBB domain-containing protein [Mucilaginibacter sp.]|uniref:SLBB domain-containing protein n=1 Tax=Mucilaginibacter sp. TaxID=1882438 RepID=UPI0035BC40E2
MRLIYRTNFKFKYFFLLLLCFATLIAAPAFSQTLPSNLNNANVNELSDAQIRQIMQQAQANNLTDAQLMQTLQARGLSADQARILQNRINTIKKANGNAPDDNTGIRQDSQSESQTRKLNYSADTINNSPASQKILNTFQSKIFGADMFSNSNLKFEPNLKIATPVNYIVGPEDQLNINVYGNSLVNWKLDVSPEGNINIPGVGILNVAGKTIEQATASIKSKLAASNYAIGKGTSVQVSLGNIRSIKVILVGEVKKPGTYTLPSLATAFNALSSAGGPNDIGSFRKIEIIRNNRVIRTLDIYDFLVKGSQKDNISLQDQDVIRVPSYRLRVDLKGEVKTPAIFEVLPGETLQDVLRFAGGFSDQAYTERIKVTQVSDQQRRLTDVFESDYKNYIPLRGDMYVVDRILERYTNRVTISGAVFRPGEFELQNGLTLSQLIKNAGGLKEDAFTGRGSIIRLNADNSKQQLSFDVNQALNNASADLRLQREDSVVISSKFDLRNAYKITIKGEVRKPGDFLYADSMKVGDLIVRAGGFTEGASAKRIEVSRRVFDSDPRALNTTVAQVFSVNISTDLKSDDSKFALQPYDIVSVYSLPGYETQKTVKVEGEVIYPGYYTIQKKNEKISDLVARAGGLTLSADVEGGSLKRDNDAVLGVDKSKIDTAALNKERNERLRRLQQSYRDTTRTDTAQLRNNYVGINLKKILQKPGTNEDLILENGDILRIPKQQQTVRVNGEVLYPSAVVYSRGKSFKEYVLNAGGFSPNSLKGGAYVVYPNGTVKGTRRFLFFNTHPGVKPGSEIYVPRKPEKRGNTAQEILAFTTGLASLGAIILGILTLSK